MGANTKDVTDATFDAEVLKASQPVIVDFWAEWCGPCRLIAPVIDEIAAEHAGKVKVVKLNTDENPKTSRDYQIMSIPNISVFKDGQLVKSIIGARPKAALLRDLADYLG